MTRDIERRLQRLESQAPPPQLTEKEKTVQIVHTFLRCAVAYYLGDPTPGGSPGEAFVRALGYSHSNEFHNAIEANDPDFNERWHRARNKLFEKFGLSSKPEWEEIVEAFRRMHAGFPDRYKGLCGLEFD
jgi:hypothetical protein